MSGNSIRFLRAVSLLLISISISFAQADHNSNQTDERTPAILNGGPPYTVRDFVRMHNRAGRMPLAVSAAVASTSPQTASYYISTVVGTGAAGYSGDGGPALSAEENFPVSAALDNNGNLYIDEIGNNCIRKVAPNGIITTVAGTGTAGFSGDGGLAIDAMLNAPAGVAVDSQGNIFIADGNNRIRKVAPNGIITTVAGTGIAGYSGDGGQATNAELNTPEFVRLDGYGNLFFTEPPNNIIRKVAANGIISTVAGNGTQGHSGDGGPATSAELGNPNGLALDAAGNIYFSDTANSVIRRVGTNGIITQVAGTPFVSGYTGDGGSANGAELNLPFGVDVDAAGDIFVADSANEAIREILADGIITTVAGNGNPGYSGDGGPATSAELFLPMGVDLGLAGKVYVLDSANCVTRLLTPATPPNPAVLTITKTHPGNFQQGQVGATYTVVVSNSPGAGPTSGTVSVSDTIPAGLTLIGMAGTGWSCPASTCSRGDALNAGASYPLITVTVSVSPTAPSLVTNQVAVSGGGSGSANASDPTTVIPSSGLALSGGSLPAGVAGGSYSTNLTARVSNGTAPYSWNVLSGNLPGGLALGSDGSISGVPPAAGTSSFVIGVTDANGLSGSASFQLTVNAAPAGTPVRVGTLAHIAAGGGWATTFTVVNTDSVPILVRVNLYAETGAYLTLPLTFPQAGGGPDMNAWFVQRSLPVNGSLVVESDALTTTAVGWADILATGQAGAFAIFRLRVPGRPDQEGTAALDSHSQASFSMPFDNTAGYVGAMAICSTTDAPATVTATAWDENGVLIGQQTLNPLPADGHTSFALSDQMPYVAGRRGVIVFQSDTGAPISALGLRFTPTASFTSVPIMYP
jgi:uncharacterized repeat protein (TIGR01451 family)